MPVRRPLARHIVQTCALPAAGQRVAASLGDDLRTDVLTNRYGIDPGVWDEMLQMKLSAADAAALCGRPLTPAQVARVAATERRAAVLSALIDHNDLDADTAARLLTGKAAAAVARALAKAAASGYPIPEPVTGTVARLAGGPTLAHHIATRPDDVDDDEAADLLTRFAEWGGRRSSARRSALGLILEHRRHLVSRFTAPGADPALVQAAAGHRHTTAAADQHAIVERAETLAGAGGDLAETAKYVLLSLANNPVCHRDVVERIAALRAGALTAATGAARNRLDRFSERPTITDPYAAVSDPGALTWLVYRVSPGTTRDGQSIPGRPNDGAELCRNPNLNDYQAGRLATALTSWDYTTGLTAIEWDAAAAALRGNHPDLAGLDTAAETGDTVTSRPTPEPPPRPDTPDLAYVERADVADLTWAKTAAQWVADQLRTEDEWRVALAMIDDATGQRVTEFVDAVHALA